MTRTLLQMKLLKLSFLLATLVTESNAQTVFTAGVARNVMMGIDLSSTVKLDTLLNQPGLFALGPLDNLQGEITVVDGIVHTSSVTNGKIVSRINPEARAPFLVYSYVNEWSTYQITAKFTELKSIENIIDSLAAKHGYGTDDAFPFLLEADWQQLHFHVIMRDTTEEKHSHESHNAAKVKYTRTNTSGTLLGFFSRHHEGVFTHRGQFAHVHYLNADTKETGHLDEVNHNGIIVVKFPLR
jgi:acetolactate decarboxylase